MIRRKNSPGFKGYRFPSEIIEYAVWLYFHFGLSLRDIEDLLAERGIIVSHETIRFWVGKFGRQDAKSNRRDRPPVGDKWHLDEVVISIGGKKHRLWVPWISKVIHWKFWCRAAEIRKPRTWNTAATKD